MESIKEMVDSWCKTRQQKNRIEEIKNEFQKLLNPYENIIIYGAGVITLPSLLKLLKVVNREPSVIVDSDAVKWGRTIGGIKVCSLEDAKFENWEKSLVIIAVRGSIDAYYAINNYLKKEGFYSIIQCGEWMSYREILGLKEYNMMSLGEENIILENVERIISLDKMLNDEISRKELREILKARMLPYDYLYDYVDMTYFPKDIFHNELYENVVDCGAYRGDTMEEFFMQELPCKTYHAFEMDPVNSVFLKEKVKEYSSETRHKIVVHTVAVGNENGPINIVADGSVGSYIDKQNGELEISCVKLDDELKNEQVTYIKMDIEGAEKEAIEGAKEIIRKNRPVLVISVYHKDDDLWVIPEMIHSIVDNYNGIIRREGLFEYLFIAYPREKKVN